jgi:mono/diheme cytochrome c family protein
MKPMRILLFSLLAVSMSACVIKHKEPYYAYAPDMHFSPGLKAQKEGSMRPPVAGTIPQGFRPYGYSTMDEAKTHLNPLPREKYVLQRGKQLFNVYCIVCHGRYGEGDGLVAAMPNWPRPLLPRPPSLQSEKIRDYKDGQIFHVMTMGQSIMPSYAEKLSEEERWSIVHYIRVLYRAKHPSEDDLKKAKDFVEDTM